MLLHCSGAFVPFVHVIELVHNFSTQIYHRFLQGFPGIAVEGPGKSPRREALDQAQVRLPDTRPLLGGHSRSIPQGMVSVSLLKSSFWDRK